MCCCRSRGANRLGTAVRGGDHEATDGATPTTVGNDVAGGRKAAMPPLGKFNSAWDISNNASRSPRLPVTPCSFPFRLVMQLKKKNSNIRLITEYQGVILHQL